MKIINSSVENITPAKYNLESIYKHIELCGRTCYKSEDKITGDSYKRFCEMIKNNNHLSCFEHGTVYLKSTPVDSDYKDVIYRHTMNNYSVVKKYCITTNMRVIIENHWEKDLQYLCEPTEFHEKRFTFRIICDRAVSHEWVRHRHLSFSQESQRYCNYSKDKYNNEITFVRPHWVNINADSGPSYNWVEAMEDAENYYFTLLDKGIKPQDARAVLPNSTKTEFVVTGFWHDWVKFIDLRTSSAAHPDIKKLAEEVKVFIYK